MRTLVIFDSFFGNTEQIGRAIAQAAGNSQEVSFCRIGDVRDWYLADIELLVVGSPTRGFRATEPIMNFIKDIPDDGLARIKVAAFDTRIEVKNIKGGIFRTIVRMGGYAAKPIADALVKKGGLLVAEPEGFYVADTEGPLKEGELERATKWAQTVKESVTESSYA